MRQNRINVINDTKPQIFVANPQNEFTIDDSRIVEIDMQIIDDYGFSDAWIEYKIIKPSYLSQDSLVYKYKINNVEINQKAQRIVSMWDISNHFLAPDDKIEFYIFVSDNNNLRRFGFYIQMLLSRGCGPISRCRGDKKIASLIAQRRPQNVAKNSTYRS